MDIVASMFAIFFLIFVVIIGSAWMQQSRIAEARGQERSNIAEIDQLRSSLLAIREKLQLIRLGKYVPSDDEVSRSIAALAALTTASSDPVGDVCFFCTSILEPTALICARCCRPNMDRLEAVGAKDLTVRRKLSGVIRG